MSNKTFIPALRAQVGDWNYYICIMKYAEVARQVAFAYELGANKDLGTMIQRGISARTEGITQYLLESKSRFLGALIVATWGGDPSYTKISMDDPDGMLSGIDNGFGVLTFDGTQQYFALDGQHRLKAIKDAVKKDPEIGREDICVLLVSHYESAEGKQRTRRLFTNINRNAKSTIAAENIALDVDDAFAILTRRLLDDHTFLSRGGVVKVFTRTGEGGELSLAGGNLPKGEKKAWTTISTLYEILKSLGFDLDPSVNQTTLRPSDAVLDKSYEILAQRLDSLLTHCGDLRNQLIATENARDLRAPKNSESTGHAFMRPVIQRAIADVARLLVEQGLLSWEQLEQRLLLLDWHIGKAPWTSVFNPETGKMIAGKDFSELLKQLLQIHLAPKSKQEIKRVRKVYKDLRALSYPIEEEEFYKYLPTGE